MADEGGKVIRDVHRLAGLVWEAGSAKKIPFFA